MTEALDILRQMHDETCPDCGGTVLPPSRAGVERGTCHCPKPGQIVAHLYYGKTDVYEVEWNGEIQQVTPPTLSRAWAALSELRAALRASQGDSNV